MDDERFGRDVEPRELEALGVESQAAIHVLEDCLRSHHVADVAYVDERGEGETPTVRPAFIRTNKAGHVVLWCMPVGVDEWRELRLDGVRGATDTGQEFTPAW